MVAARRTVFLRGPVLLLAVLAPSGVVPVASGCGSTNVEPAREQQEGMRARVDAMREQVERESARARDLEQAVETRLDGWRHLRCDARGFPRPFEASFRPGRCRAGVRCTAFAEFMLQITGACEGDLCKYPQPPHWLVKPGLANENIVAYWWGADRRESGTEYPARISGFQIGEASGRYEQIHTYGRRRTFFQFHRAPVVVVTDMQPQRNCLCR